MPIWYPELPQRPLQRGFSWSAAKNRIETEMESGPKKRRRRTSVLLGSMTLIYRMSKEQLAAFEAFYRDELADGSFVFDLPDPRLPIETEEFLRVAIQETYSIEPVRSDAVWDVSFSVEVRRR